jgi:hypothetical protein
MDMEGGEWAVMADARFRKIPARAIVLEYHGDSCPRDDATAAATDLMRAAGYELRPLFYDPKHDAGMLWGWREPAVGD